MAKAISSFGIYLGSMEPKVMGDCQTWSIFLATDDLAWVLLQIELRVGGLVYTAEIYPRKWIKGQVFQRSDLSPTSVVYHSPATPAQSPKEPITATTMLNSIFFQGEDVIPMKLSALREIFRKFSPAELPPEFATCLAGDEQAIAANHTAYRIWEEEVERRRMAEQPRPPHPTEEVATQDPVGGQLMPIPSQTPAQSLSRAPGLGLSHPRLHVSPQSSRPKSHASPHSSPPADHASTVHRTDLSRGKRSQTDMAMQVCTPNPDYNCVQNSRSWDPCVLFPEISASVLQPPIRAANVNITKSKKGLTKSKVMPTLRPRRSTRNKNSRITNGDKGMIEIEVHDFIDAPLRNEEGRELLALIGANDVPLPTHVILPPSHQQMSNLEVGQSSGAQPKRNKPVSPTKEALQGLQLNELDLPPAESDGKHTGLSNNVETQSMDHTLQLNQLGNHSANENPTVETDSLFQSNAGGTDALDDLEEDPYFDRVDYSDEDLAL